MHSLLHATLALLHLPAKQIEWAKLTHITLEHRRSPPTYTHTHLHTLSRVGLLSRNTCWILQQLLCWSDCLRLFSCLLDIGLTWPEVLPICISIARAHTQSTTWPSRQLLPISETYLSQCAYDSSRPSSVTLLWPNSFVMSLLRASVCNSGGVKGRGGAGGAGFTLFCS